MVFTLLVSMMLISASALARSALKNYGATSDLLPVLAFRCMQQLCTVPLTIEIELSDIGKYSALAMSGSIHWN